MITAGLFDLQVNGFGGIDFNDATLTPEAFDHALEAMLATGVTQFLPTLITASEKDLSERFVALDSAIAKSRLGKRMAIGYHLEGPFLNPEPGFRGCHPAADMTRPDIALVDRLQANLRNPILLITIAPELPGAEKFIRDAGARHIAIAAGHTDARNETISLAAGAGLGLSTHLGNGAAQNMHKFDNPIMAQLAEDRMTACFIADGIHIAPSALRVMVRAKGLARSVLVTDAVAAAAVPAGIYGFAGMKVERGTDGSVRVPGAPTLAGSSLTLDQAVRNVCDWGICTFDEAVELAGGNARAAVAKAVRGHNLQFSPGEITWSADRQVLRVNSSG